MDGAVGIDAGIKIKKRKRVALGDDKAYAVERASSQGCERFLPGGPGVLAARGRHIGPSSGLWVIGRLLCLPVYFLMPPDHKLRVGEKFCEDAPLKTRLQFVGILGGETVGCVELLPAVHGMGAVQ